MNASASAAVEQFKKKLNEELAKVIVEESSGPSGGGQVMRFADGVAEITGLPDPRIGQVLDFADSTDRAQKDNEDEPPICGIIEDITETTVKCLVLGEERFVSQGDKVKTNADQLRVPVSHLLLGHVWDPLCRSLEPKGESPDLTGALQLPVERKAPGVTDRLKIDSQMKTGINAVDTMLPIGRGQRMLLIGDRGTGKTSIALDAIIRQNEINQKLNGAQPGNPDEAFRNHKPETVYCVYVGIGKKASEIRQIRTKLMENGAMEYTAIVTTMANDPAPLGYVCPFSGCTIAEYFRDIGRNALIVYDDLSKHATAYRQLSLILKRPPGREAYPGDIFFLHSRLLERAARIRPASTEIAWSRDFEELMGEYKGTEHDAAILGGGSLTALPLVETKLDDYATYIATNVISITDGQIFLSMKLKNEGVLPAINVGISVSRVRSAWDPLLRDHATQLRVDMAVYRSLEELAAMDTSERGADSKALELGRRRVAYFMQDERPAGRKSDKSLIFSTERQLVDLIMLYDDGILEVRKDRIRDLEASVWEGIVERSGLLEQGKSPSGILKSAVAEQIQEYIRQNPKSKA